VFEEAGVEFIGGPGDGPGVRLWVKQGHGKLGLEKTP